MAYAYLQVWELTESVQILEPETHERRRRAHMRLRERISPEHAQSRLHERPRQRHRRLCLGIGLVVAQSWRHFHNRAELLNKVPLQLITTGG